MKKLFKKVLGIKHNSMKERVAPWFAVDGDRTLRLDYKLDENSVVFDFGGYHGTWAADIFCKYGCYIHVFEPANKFVEIIRNKFSNNKKIFVHPFGLSDSDEDLFLSSDNDASSVFQASARVDAEKISLIDAEKFFKENNVDYINLMKINIEGGEYALLERLIELGYTNKIENIQIQFHDFVPNAKSRMDAIKQKLSETHYLTYEYEFVWENWKLKTVN